MAKTETTTETAVALIGTNDFRAVAVLGETGENMMELMRENVGDQISIFDFPKMTVPAGGGDIWMIPTLEGTKPEKEFEGVIVKRKSGKSYWEKSLDDVSETTPPDCASEDGLIGIGTPGGVCSTCPFNQYGSAPKGAGKACKDKGDLVLLTKTGIMPMVIQVPPTSLKNLKQYGMLLLDAGKDISKVVTKFTLTTETKGGKKTAIIQFRSGGDVDPSMFPFIAKYKETMNALIDTQKATAQATAQAEAAAGPATDGEAPTFEG